MVEQLAVPIARLLNECYKKPVQTKRRLDPSQVPHPHKDSRRAIGPICNDRFRNEPRDLEFLANLSTNSRMQAPHGQTRHQNMLRRPKRT